MKLRGFATLTAMAIMLLLVTYLIIGATTSSQVELGLHRVPIQAKAEAWAKLDSALKLLKETWDPEKQRFSTWSVAHPVSEMTWDSLSGKMNLNTISPFILALPGFSDTLKGVSVEKFTQVRSLAGPSPDLQSYKDLIQPVALNTWYTVHSLWNLNTADEVMLEAMASQRSGSGGVGSAIRASVRTFREQTKRMSAEDWVRVGGSGATVLDPLVTVEPELDVNEAPESLLLALVSNPAWSVAQPSSKVQTIVQKRNSQPWTLTGIKALLAVPDDNLLLCYLGVQTRFLGGSIKTSGGTLDFVIFMEAPNSPRILKTTWSAS